MRIHAGVFKNHVIKRVNIETTKETSSMVRQAVFNMIGPANGKVLDLFAGSGSYGFTAFSLGAEEITFIDNNLKAINTIKENVNKLKISNNTTVKKMDYETFLKQDEKLYNYIFLDPPYDFDKYELLVNQLATSLEINGKIILELNFKTKIHLDNINLSVLKDKKYGIKRIIVFIK